MDRCDRVLVKKLSNNDRGWARKPKTTNQDGPYIPVEQRDGGFFPPLMNKARPNPEDAPIREVFFTTRWPQAELEKRSRLVNYTSKGSETHLTGVPKELFAELLPASFLVMGRFAQAGEYAYECITIDSDSDEAALLSDLFVLDADFLIGEFVPADLRAHERECILDFAERVIAAWQAGTINLFAAKHAVIPATVELARMAREAFLEKNALSSLNPFVLPQPGDALREISRSIEWDLFREFQRRDRSVALVRVVLGDEPRTIEPAGIIRRLVEELWTIDAVMMSAAQQRKSRAGYSYEHHIEAMLAGGGIPFEKQVIIEARKRPDFVLPSLAFIDSGLPDAKTGLILSAKTTLRERWKQVQREMEHRQLYLTTVDENIAGNAIEDMASLGVQLVIPEGLMEKKETEYSGHRNVHTFGEFCEKVISPKLKGWV